MSFDEPKVLIEPDAKIDLLQTNKLDPQSRICNERITPRHRHTDVMLPGERQCGFLRAARTDVDVARFNTAPGNVALVLNPPRTRSLPGAFFVSTANDEFER